MTLIMKSCVKALFILFLWRAEEGAEAGYVCHCPIMKPPLQTICDAAVVIRASVTGSEVVDRSIKYDISVIQVFKGTHEDIDAVYSSLMCTTYLQTDKADYLITGSLGDDGTVQITICNFIVLWNDLTPDELNLLQNYQNCNKH